MNHRRTRLQVERLEDRSTPASFGNPWPDAGHLTLSFAPDGTQVGDQTSELFRWLDSVAPRGVWQRELLRAAQTWAASANIDWTVVADSGLPLGTAGAPQGDARFGDLRVVAVPMPLDDEGGDAGPFQADAGTWTGDITLNSSALFAIAQAGAYDLYSVFLHEIGHALGLDHCDNPASVMYEGYRGVRSGLNSIDVAAIQSLYGARTPDRYEGAAGNHQLSQATPLGVNSTATLSAAADITTLSDRDVYSFTTLLNIGGAVLTVRTAGNSLLTPRVSVLDASGKQVVSAVAVDPLAGGLSIRLSNLRALTTYYVQVEGGQTSPFGVGSYQLTVTPLPLVSGLLGGVNATVSYTADAVTGLLFNDDLHTNDSFATALNLQQTLAQPDNHFDYGFRGSISDARDVDFYRIQAPAAPAGSDLVLTAMIWHVGSPALNPRVRVFDARQNLVAAEVLSNDGATYVLQIHGAVPQATYYVEALPAVAGNTTAGNYFLGVDFGLRAIEMQTFVTGTLSDAQPSLDRSLRVDERRRFHLVLAAAAEGNAAGAAVSMTIMDSTGRVVFTLSAGSAEPVSGIVDLSRGAYTVRFTATIAGGGPLPTMNFTLRGNELTKPIGPESNDPTGSPSGGSGSGSSPTYDWNGTGSSGVSSSNPASDPYASGSTGTNSSGSTTTTAHSNESGGSSASDSGESTMSSETFPVDEETSGGATGP